MTTSVQQLLVDAMAVAGAVDIDETPSGSDMQVVLRAANRMINMWSSQRLLLRSDIDINFTMTAGKASYTVGLQGTDIVAAKPIAVHGGYVTDSNIDHGMDYMTKDNYDMMEDKNVSQSRPSYVAYDPGNTQQHFNTGTFYFYNTPDKAYPCSVSCTTILTEFVSLSDEVQFDPTYHEPLVYNIALRIFRLFNGNKKPIPQDVVAIANAGLSHLKTMNSVTYIAACDIPGKVSNYNVYTDGYN